MTSIVSQEGREAQAEVINFLANPASYSGVGRVARFETHGNLVFLAGSEAWKIKRAVRLPYMDFSTLEKRHTACSREVEINRTFAPELYLGCVPIGRSSAGKLEFGATEDIIEWAVHMRRFDQSALLSDLALRQALSSDLACMLADAVYESHERAQRAAPSSGIAPMRELANALSGALAKSGVFGTDEVARFSSRVVHQLDRAAAILDERAARGFVRRCHGDLHLANIVMWQGRPVLYDAIEFDEAIATTDTLYDLAFLLMDLDWHQQRPAANIVLNRYLWLSREEIDLRGLVALPLFLALRAAVRARVTADRAVQEPPDARNRDIERARCYVRASLDYLAPRSPQLIVVGGLSGTGKTTLAVALAPCIGSTPGAVLLRSDLVRKAMAGVGEFDRLTATAYTKAARKQVYARLCEKTRLVLTAGHSVIVDAVYADEDERQSIQAIAEALGVPFRGLWLKADPERLIDRVVSRTKDASDATPETVRTQLQFDPGSLSQEWNIVDAGGTASETLGYARAALGLVP